MSDNIIEITQNPTYTISIETSLDSNNNVTIETSNPTNSVDVINNTTVLVGDLPQGYPLDWTVGNLSINRINGLTAVSGVNYSSGVISLSNIPIEFLPVKNLVSGSGINIVNNEGIYTVAVTGNFGLTGEQVDDRVSNLLKSGNYVNLNYDDLNDSLTISLTGIQPSGDYSIVGHSHSISDINNLQNILDNKQPSGNYASGIHYHSSSDIIDFNNSVSGLLPSISNGGDNRILTSTGSSFGINANSNLLFDNDSSILSVSGAYPSLILKTQYLPTFISTLWLDSLNSVIWLNADQTSYIESVQDSVVLTAGLFSKTNLKLNSDGIYYNNIPISISGHKHASSDITNFNSSVSGLVSGIYAPLNSPNFSGIPTAPTAPSGSSNNQIANTQFVRTEISNLVNSAPSTLDTLNELAIALGNDSNFATTIASGLAGKASLAHSHSSSDITNFDNSVSGLLTVTNVTGSSGILVNNSGTTYNVSSSGLAFLSGANFSSLSVTGVPVSVSGHSHSYTDIANWASGIENEVSTLLVAGSYINLNYDNLADTLTISASGLQPSGNYANATHTHSTSDITNFSSSVSGLFPSDIATGVGVSGYLTKWNGINTISTGIMYDNGTNIGIGTTTPSELLDVSGNILAHQFISNRDNNSIAGSGQIVLDGANGNRIDFNNNGIGPPSFTTNRSVGTKIILAPNTSSTQTEYALGIEAGAMWFSIPVAASRAFQWYAGTANIATLFGNGTLDIKGNTSRINVDDLRLDDNVISTTASNSNLILMPNGSGALLADTGGNLRGIYSNDFQRERTSVSGVASGGYSVICGGSDNRTANSYSIVCGGQSNTASNAWSVVCGGDLNNATGNRSVICGGGSNTSSAASSSIGGGSNNQAIASYAIVPGGFRGKATRIGELSHAAGMFNNTGDAQHTILIARRLTTDATANVVLTLNGAAPAETNILSISAQTMWTFSIKLSAYNLTNNQAAWWIFRGGIRRNNANSTVLVGSLITESGAESTLSTASATVVANDTDEALEIRVTGVAAKSIRWVAVADISQVSYGVV